jgi:hypothetical protein
VPLPETIAVKYTEEEAEYLSMRPLVRQTFRAAELVDMIVQVAGKDSARVQQILRAGTVVFHSFRYWWPPFDPAALAEILAKYPDADPARPFRSADCTEVILESSGSPPRHSLRITKESVAKSSALQKITRALSNKPSFWQVLMNFAEEAHPRPRYREYSYTRRADLYSIALIPAQIARLAREAAQHAPRTLRAEMLEPPAISQIVFLCPRTANSSS